MYKNLTEFKKAWVKALRSGQYQQGAGALCEVGNDHDHFCCLGVAGNLLIEDGNNFEWSFDDDTDRYMTLTNKTTGENSYEVLDRVAPAWLRNWLYRHEDDVIIMNDGGKTFNQIADYIEQAK